MDKDLLFEELKIAVEKRFRFLPDKPEETADSTLKALWFKAAGFSISTEKAVLGTLPELTDDQVSLLHEYIHQRESNVPLAHITGKQSFMGIEMLSDRRALIPRKETEILGNKALEISFELCRTKNKITIIDVCCGSGNVGLALAYHNPCCWLYATDISQEAVDLARENAVFLGLTERVTLEQGDLLTTFDNDHFHNQVDLIVCNPPYISSGKVTKMDVEISAHEPALAFDGGMLGTNIIQRLLREVPKFLIKKGCFVFEVGLGQGPFIMQLCKKINRFNKIETVNDENNYIRTIIAQM